MTSIHVQYSHISTDLPIPYRFTALAPEQWYDSDRETALNGLRRRMTSLFQTKRRMLDITNNRPFINVCVFFDKIECMWVCSVGGRVGFIL